MSKLKGDRMHFSTSGPFQKMRLTLFVHTYTLGVGMFAFNSQ